MIYYYIIGYLLISSLTYLYDVFIGYNASLDGNDAPPLIVCSLVWIITIPYFSIRYIYRYSKYLKIKYLSNIIYINNLFSKIKIKKSLNGKVFNSDAVYFYKNNKLHCLDGPAIIYYNGDFKWYKEDKLHREDGPAVEYADGDKFWYKEGQLHRLDGPAIEYANGSKCWYLNGKEINCKSQKEFEKFLKLKAFA